VLNFNHLRLFEAVARAGSVSRAAEELRLSQPALSKQVRELEAALGVALLERLPRGVRATEAGELLAGYARQIFALGEEAERALAELRGLGRGRLRLGASMTIGVYLAPTLLAESRRRWPGLAIECAIENTDTIQQGLVEHGLDLGLTEGPGKFDGVLEGHIFRWDELVVVAGAGQGVAEAPTLRELAGLAWVMREPGSGTRAVVEAALGRRGVRVTPAWTFNNPEAVKRAVMAGAGVAMIPALTAEEELERGQLRRLRVRGLRVRRALRVQWLRGRPASAAMAAFVELLGAPQGLGGGATR